jgi:hypothetical protein
MTGYCYLDFDGNITYKTNDYISTVDPGFFNNNKHLIVKYWKFNTEDRSSMIRLMRDFTDLKLQVTPVENFFRSINFVPKKS